MAMVACTGIKIYICTCICHIKIGTNVSSGLEADSSHRTALQDRGGFEAI